MARYMKKPIIVEAEQYWPDKKTKWVTNFHSLNGAFIKTSKGEEVVLPGNWIVVELNDDGPVIEIVKDSIFKKTYELIDLE